MTALSMLVKTCSLHVVAVDRGDDGAVRDGDDEGGGVDEDDRLARALAGGAVDAVARGGASVAGLEVDAAALDALQRVRRELDRLRLRRAAARSRTTGRPASESRRRRRARRPAGARPGGSSAGLCSTTLIAPR